jgi:hypothetical protein
MGGKEATPSMSKKERATMLQKTQRTIVANAHKQVIIQKANGQKSFFVTCDSSRKPKPPIEIYGSTCCVPIIIF